MEKLTYKYSKTVRVWLNIGLIMLVGQVVIGGITRLTGSGLSITSWDIITGVIPPLNTQQWIDAFDLYKETPQFKKINSSFTLNDFKFIYFWEYFHRLWVRSLGFIFLFPFIYFVIRRKIDFKLIVNLGIVVLLAAITASAGWIMVKSGLVDRPWVNAYKLTLHFVLAMLVVAAMVKIIADVYKVGVQLKQSITKLIKWVLGITFVQMIFAGLMAGMKAGLYYPSWPSMNGAFIPKELMVLSNWNTANLINYDSYLFTPALVQFTHRLLAYILLIVTAVLFFKLKKFGSVWAKNLGTTLLAIITLQLILGILTVLNVQGKIPLFLGVSHQFVGLIYFITILLLYFSIAKKRT